MILVTPMYDFYKYAPVTGKHYFGHFIPTTNLSGIYRHFKSFTCKILVYGHVSRGATALLINRACGKGLIVDSTSANSPLLGNPFLTSTGWCEKYFFLRFFTFRDQKKV